MIWLGGGVDQNLHPCRSLLLRYPVSPRPCGSLYKFMYSSVVELSFFLIFPPRAPRVPRVKRFWSSVLNFIILSHRIKLFLVNKLN